MLRPAQSPDHTTPATNGPLAPLSLNLHENSYNYHVQVARAERAVKRFRGFENGLLTKTNAHILIDDFLVATIEIRHIKDAVMKREGDKEKMNPSLKAFLEGSPVQPVIADICNGAKHSGVEEKRRYVTSSLMLCTQGDPPFEKDATLADYYARMVIKAGERHWRPQDLLSEALSEWNTYFLESGLVGRDFLESMSRST